MHQQFNIWWKQIPPQEKSGLMTLAAICGAIAIFTAGVKLGQVFSFIF